MPRFHPSVRLLPLVLLVTALHCTPAPEPDLAPGVPLALAEDRAARVSDLRVALDLSIPDSSDARIGGTVALTFTLADAGRPLALDFTGAPEDVLSLRIGDSEVAPDVRDEHVVLPADALVEGENRVEIAFRAGDGSLNRREDYLYTLFVPDRARYAFPCFDQPDLKARYTLALDLPAAWTAVSNAPATDTAVADGRARIRYAETAPLPTYLFAFAAGRFSVVEGERDGRAMRFLHRETDADRIARNVEAVFDLHAEALAWLEAYTAQPYPFEKFDFVLIPAFQFGGMEHPGAIFYGADRLLLDPSATQAEQLGRASLIAHETAHMWFGDLVTMRWFDDVWTKEVFANFMAAKIVNPSFPDVNHDLRFLLAHYPGAYAVDRTAGTHPIRQPLDNLDDAGSLYGPIIYQKAPIVMRQLERLLGETALRDGLRTYLERFAYGNATWPELIAILDRGTDTDLAAWSRRWVEEAGRPVVAVERIPGPDSTLSGVRLSQIDPLGQSRTWNQEIDFLLAYPGDTRSTPYRLDEAVETVDVEPGFPPPLFILPNGRGLGYGRFDLDPTSRDTLLQRLPDLSDEQLRASAWLALWDGMLEGEIAPNRLARTGLRALAVEPVEQNAQRFLNDLRALYWRFLDPAVRDTLAPEIEELLWTRMLDAPTASMQKTYFDAYRSVALTEEGVAALHDVWRGELRVEGLTLSEDDEMRLALDLAVRGFPESEAVLDAQQARIANDERRARFVFVRPAVSADPAVRDSLFGRLTRAEHRLREPWVLEAVRYLHHPLRVGQSVEMIRPALDLLEEIRETGSIFFPARWLDAVLDGHRSAEAADAVQAFLDERADLPPRLRGKVLQAADGLFRAVRIAGTGPGV